MVFLYFLGNISVYAIQNIEIPLKNMPGNIWLAHMEFVSSKNAEVSDIYQSQVFFSQNDENNFSYEIPKFPHALEKFWENKILSLLLGKNWFPKLKIFRNIERCFWDEVRFWNGDKIFSTAIWWWFEPCIYKNSSLKTNTFTKWTFTLQTKTWKNTISFYPIDPTKYNPMTLWEADAGKWLIPLTFMDPLAEIYWLHIELRKGESDLIVWDQNIQRKLKLVRYTLRNSDGTSSSTLWVFPYYELILPDWENTYEVSYRYASYTPVVWGNFIQSK